MRKLREVHQAEVAGRAVGPRDRAGVRGVVEHGQRVPRAHRARWAQLAAAARARRRHRARAAALPRRAPPRLEPAGARLDLHPPRVAAAARHEAAAMARVQGGHAGRAPVQPVLRSVPALGEAAVGDDAAGAPRRREDVRGLQRQRPRCREPAHRGAPEGGALPRSARRVQPDVRGAGSAAGPADVGGLPRSRLRVLRWHERDLGAGQSAGRRDEGEQVRAGAQPDVRGPRGALRRGGDPGSAVQASRQGEGRGGGADRLPLDPCGAAEPHLLLDGGDAGRGRGAAGEVEPPADAAPEEVAARALQRDRARRPETPAGAALRVRRVGSATGRPQLPRRARRPLLQRPLLAHRGAPRPPRDGDHRRDHAAGHADRELPAQLREGEVHDAQGAHAARPPRPGRVDAGAADGVGAETGPQTTALVEASSRPSRTRSRASRRASESCGSEAVPGPIERAAARALHFRTLSSGSVASMLKNNLDQLPLPGQEEPQQASASTRTSAAAATTTDHPRPRRRASRRPGAGHDARPPTSSRPGRSACSWSRRWRSSWR